MIRLLIALIFACGIASPSLAASHGSPYANTGSSVGLGLTCCLNVPYLNQFKASIGWTTRTASVADTSEEVFAYANCLDANGYPQHLPCQATGAFNATFNGTTMMVVNSLTSGVAPWLGGTLNVTGSPTITACPGGVCGGTGSYTISATVASATTAVTQTPTFTILAMGTLSSINEEHTPFYPGGNGSWELMYDGDDNGGSTNFEYHNDVSLASHSCAAGTCTDVLNATPSSSGFFIFLDTTDTNSNGKYVKNVRLVLTAHYNALTAAQKTEFNAGTSPGSTAGIFFNFDWINLIQNIRSFRFMDWNATNNNPVSAWGARQPVDFVFWNDNVKYNQDIPIEVRIALANKVHANAWEVLPCLADDTFKTQDATLWLNLLNPSLKVIVEVCNEAWNHNFGSTALLNGLTNDQSVFTSCAIGFPCLIDNYAYRTIRTALLWQAVWTGANASRITPVMGGQFGNDGLNQFELGMTTAQDGCCGTGTPWSGAAGTHMGAVSVAPYYPSFWTSRVPNSWTIDADAGQYKWYKQFLYGGLMPVATGNCGNGVAVTCTPVSNLHFTLTSGLSLPATPTNGTCVDALSNAAGGSTANDLAVDGGTAFGIFGNDGVAVAVQNGTNYIFCFTSAQASVASSATLSAGGSGYSNGSQVLTMVGGNCPLPPQFLVNVSGGVVQSGITVSRPGLCPSTPSNPVATSGGGGTGATLTVSYPSLTTGWQVQEWPGSGSPCFWEFACQNYYLNAQSATAVSYGIKFIGYEGSDNSQDFCWGGGNTYCGNPAHGNPILDGFFLAFQSSPYLYQLQQAWLETLKANGLVEQHYFTDPGLWQVGKDSGNSSFTMWAFSPGTYAAINPTVRKQELDDYIRRTPCWWAGCRN